MAEMNFSLMNTNAPMDVANAYQQGINYANEDRANRQQYALNQMLIDERQKKAVSENAFNNAYASSGGDLTKLKNVLLEKGLGREAMQVQSKIDEQQKAKIEQATATAGLMKHYATRVMSSPSLDNAIGALTSMQHQTGIDMSDEIASVQKLGNNPEAIRSWAAGHALTADKLLPNFQHQDIGSAVVNYSQDPITGKITPIASMQKSMSPGEIAADARSRAQLAQSERHFQATHGLEREKMASKGAQPESQRIQDANDALNIIGEAEAILNKGKTTSSYVGKLRDVAAQAVGIGTEGAQESAQLKALAGALVSKMPKMSGPQSDKDVQLYREMAGQIGDETIPISVRKAAIKTVRTLQEKYAGKPVETSSHPSDIQDLLKKYGG